MKRASGPIGVLIGALFLITSCTKEQNREEKVSMIINEINAPFLIVNASPNTLIEKSGAMDGALPFTYEMLVAFFLDKDVTGVDYDVDVQIVATKGPSFIPNVYGIFSIKNESAFIDLLETEANAKVEEKDGYKYVIKDADQYVIVWKEDFAIASNIPLDLLGMLSGGSNQGMSAVSKNIRLMEAVDGGEVNPEYLTFLQNESDISARFNGKGLYAYLDNATMGAGEEIKNNQEMIEGLNADIHLNFNEGNISLELLSDIVEEVKEEINFLRDGGINADLLNYGYTQHPAFSASYHLDFAKGLDYSEEKMGEYEYGKLQEALNDIGLSRKQAEESLSGDILFIMDHIELREELIDWGYGEPYVNKTQVPVFGLVVGVSDIKGLMGLADSTETRADGLIKKDGAFMVMKEGFIFSSNDSLWAAKVQSGETVTITNKDDVLTSEPIGMFLNFEKYGDFGDLEEAAIVTSVLDYLTAGGNIDNFNLRIELKDKTKNALRVLTETIANATIMIDEDQAELMREIEEAAQLEEEMEN